MSSTGLTWKAKVVRMKAAGSILSGDATTIALDDYPYQKTVQKTTQNWVRITLAQLKAKLDALA